MPFSPTPRNVYLLSYNLLQSILWLHTLSLLAYHLPQHLHLPQTALLSPAAITALYSKVSPSALLSQRLSWLEVLHAAVGLAGGGIGAAFIQALGRSAILLVLVEASATARASVCAPLLIAAAAGSDLVRYLFYSASLLHRCPRWLSVLRYSTFLPAYPVRPGYLPFLVSSHQVGCFLISAFHSLFRSVSPASGSSTMSASRRWTR